MVGRLKQHFVRLPGRMREFQGLSVWYGGYGGYRYWYRFDRGDTGIGISVLYRFFNVISVSHICISISYRYSGIGISQKL